MNFRELLERVASFVVIEFRRSSEVLRLCTRIVRCSSIRRSADFIDANRIAGLVGDDGGVRGFIVVRLNFGFGAVGRRGGNGGRLDIGFEKKSTIDRSASLRTFDTLSPPCTSSDSGVPSSSSSPSLLQLWSWW